MHPHYTQNDPLLALRPHLSKPRWVSVVLLVLALPVVQSCIVWKIAVAVFLPIRVESAYQRLKRLLGWPTDLWTRLKIAWLLWVIDHFTCKGQRLHLLIDWTMHTDRVRSLWVQLVCGSGRSIPLTFWLADNQFGGPGKQRAFEDDCLRQLHGWLPDGWPVLLIGDRGFGGRDRMRFIQKDLDWLFCFRITGDAKVALEQWVQNGRSWCRRVHYQRVDADPPPPGGRWQKEGVRYGRGHAITVNLVAARLPTEDPKADAVWYLATNLPLHEDVVAVYAQRMQIEQSFRDAKSNLGMEKEYTRQPSKRLQGLLVVIMIVLGRQIWQGRQALADSSQQAASPARPDEPAAPVQPPTASLSLPKEGSLASGPKRYRVVSDARRGWHEMLVEVVLQEGPIRQAVVEAAKKSERMQQRPQVCKRRIAMPTKSRAQTGKPASVRARMAA